MQNRDLLETLKELGLSDNEALVYIYMLSAGPTTVLAIAKDTQIKRTTIYSVLSSLQRKGLVSIEIKGLKRLFITENPERLKRIIDNKKEKLLETLPGFAALYNLKGNESFIKYYEGLNNIKSVYDRLLEDVPIHSDYLVIGSQQEWLDLDPEFFLNFTKRRAKLNIHIRLLLQDSTATREHKRLEKNFNEKIKILPAGTALTTNMIIIPQRVVIHQLIPPVLAVEVDNASIVQTHREMFEIIWKSIPD